MAPLTKRCTSKTLEFWSTFAAHRFFFSKILNQSFSVASTNDPSAPITHGNSPSSSDLSRDANNKNSGKSDGHPRGDFDAAIFDMDGVITKTAAVHSLAWKRMFDEFLQLRAATRNEPFKEFTHEHDYLSYVDGRPRYKGVETFLKSRGIDLPLGTPEDLPGTDTICALGNQKNVFFNQVLESDGVSLFDSTIVLIQEMLQRGIKVGLATSSKNSAVILKKTGTAPLFATVVDGIVSAKLGLKGKPEPDIFTTAAANLGVPLSLIHI